MHIKRIVAAGCLLLLAAIAAQAEEIGQVSTTFKFLGANDKIMIEAFDDPDISGDILRAELDHRLGGFFGRLVEGWQDNIRSVRIFQDMLKEKGTRISDFNNFFFFWCVKNVSTLFKNIINIR